MWRGGCLERSLTLVFLIAAVSHSQGGGGLTCTSGATYASTFSAGGVTTTPISTSIELNSALSSLSSSNPSGAILDLAAGTYNLDQAYDLVGNICIQSTGAAATSIEAASSSRHLTKSSGILQLVGLTVAGGSNGFTHGGIAISGGQAAFEEVEFSGNDNTGAGNGGALEVTGGSVYIGDSVVFDSNAAFNGGQISISSGEVTAGRYALVCMCEHDLRWFVRIESSR